MIVKAEVSWIWQESHAFNINGYFVNSLTWSARGVELGSDEEGLRNKQMK